MISADRVWSMGFPFHARRRLAGRRPAGQPVGPMYDTARGKDADFNDLSAADAPGDFQRLQDEWRSADAAVADMAFDDTFDVNGDDFLHWVVKRSTDMVATISRMGLAVVLIVIAVVDPMLRSKGLWDKNVHFVHLAVWHVVLAAFFGAMLLAQHGAGAGTLIGLAGRHISAALPAPGQRGTGRCVSGRTRPACGRPWTRSRRPARDGVRRGRRWCDPPCRG